MIQYVNPVRTLNDTSDYSIEKSPAYLNRYFELTIVPGGYGNSELNAEIIDDIMYYPITGILDDIPSVSLSTEWEVAGIAKLSEHVKKYAENSMIKTFSQMSPNYMTPVETDGWTQKFPKQSCLLNFDLSFRAYRENIYNTLNYMDIIKILTYATAPKRYYITDSLNAIADGGDLAVETGKELVHILDTKQLELKNLSNDNMKDENKRLNLINDITNISKRLSSIYDSIMNYLDTNSTTGGCSKFKLSINSFIKTDPSIYFFVKNWSFTPSSETIYYNDRHYPAYIDFKITVESDRYLSNKTLSKILL